MAAEVLRFYLDENMPVVIAEQLWARGIDVVTTRDLGVLGDADDNHLRRAAEMGRVLCTQDNDFVVLAAQGHSHAGIVLGQQGRHSIGGWVRVLELMHGVYAPEDMVNRVEYL